MDNELEEIRKRKFQELKKKYMIRGNKMDVNTLDIPIKITDADFEENIKKYKTIVIDCWAPWCGPCRIVALVIDELAKEMAGKIVFGKLNVDENPIISGNLQIMSIPMMLVYKDGNLVDRLVGAYPKEELKKKLEIYE
jgi:thioredoxin 1